MSAILERVLDLPINEEIKSHPAWLGNISGLDAEKMLRGKTPYLYVLRQGEHEGYSDTDYYVSFVLPDLSIRHQPFVITVTSDAWYYENYGAGGPYLSDMTIDDILHLIMHCEKGENKPLIAKRK